MDILERAFIYIIFILLIAAVVVQDDKIYKLKESQKVMENDIVALQKKVSLYPIDHTRIDSNVELIGSKVFTNWKMASKLYARRK